MDFNTVNKNVRVVFFSLFVSFFFSNSFAAADDWPHWRGPDYDGISKETGWDAQFGNQGPKVLWQFDAGMGFSAISVANGKAYLTGNKNDVDIVYCLDAESGKQIWQYTYNQALDPKYYQGGTSATPTVSDGKVYTISKDGITLCIDAETGKLIWRRDISKEYGFQRPTWGYSGSVLVEGDLLILNAGRRGLALNKSDGKLVWGADKEPGGYATPVPFEMDGKKRVLIFGARELICVETETGKQLWEYPWETKHDVNAADPVIIGSRIFISSGYGTGCAMLQVKDGRAVRLWSNKNIRTKMSGCVYVNGLLFGPDEREGLKCIDPQNGTVLWANEQFQQGTLCAADGKLIVLSEDGTLAIVKASKGGCEVISSAKVLDSTCWAMPVLADGKLYVRDSKRNAKCLDLGGKGQTKISKTNSGSADWPQWQGIRRDNISDDTGLLKKWPANGPELIFSVDGLGKGYSSPVVSGGTVYVTGMVMEEGVLFSIGMDGEIKWKTGYGREWTKNFGASRTTPTVSDGKVYVFSGVGELWCIDAESGESVWSQNVRKNFYGEYPTFGYAESPLVVDGKVICTPGGRKAAIAAFDKDTGRLVWAGEPLDTETSYCSPIAVKRGGKTLAVQAVGRYLVGVDTDNGSYLWKYDTFDYKPGDAANLVNNTNSPVYKDGRIFLTSGYNAGSVELALSQDGTEVTKIWENHDLDTHHGGVVLVDGYIYGSNWLSNSRGDWLCVDFETGRTVYDARWQGNKGSVTYADGMLYCYDEKEGTVGLVAADPEKFDVVSSFDITMGSDQHWAHPVVCGGKLYIRHGDVLMVYNVKANG